ncbi:MAG: VWA domain-containing protein [Alphaproteobacteria bacterium]|nr:VWA domain-containing protein [Alphaproteobacteria bacterium]
MIEFLYPKLLTLIVLPFFTFWLLPPVKQSLGRGLRVPFIDDLENIKNKASRHFVPAMSKKVSFSLLFLYLYLLWCLLVIGIARPQYVGEPFRLNTENRDIMLVIDISTSMLQPDFSTNNKRIDRLSAVKYVVGEFVKKRTEDRIGLILFGTRAYLQSPLTFDKEAIKNILYNADAGMAGNSTSIGDALGLALKSIKDDKNKSNKVIILLSDGESNDGYLSMAEAIDMAEKEGLKVYTIGVGAENSFLGGLLSIRNNELDEKSLKELASKTKGNYFRATDLSSLKNIYERIDKLEPVENQGNIVRERKDLFYIPLLIALILAMVLLFLPRSSLE